jgi:hypothetical protein
VAIVLALQLPARAAAEQGPPGFPHDSQLLEKLHGGRFSEIGGTLEDKLSLSAVIQAFNFSACKLKGADVDAVSLVRYMGYWRTQQEQLSLALVKLHPLWLGTAQAISNRGGCQGQWAQTTLRNLFRLLDERTRPGYRDPTPPVVRPKDPLSGQTIYRSALGRTAVMPFGKRFAAAQQYMQMRGLLDAKLSLQELRAQVAAIPDTAETLTCEYFINDSYHRSLLYWRGQKPEALTDALEASLPKGHPVFAFGPPKLNCPFEMEAQPAAPPRPESAAPAPAEALPPPRIGRGAAPPRPPSSPPETSPPPPPGRGAAAPTPAFAAPWQSCSQPARSLESVTAVPVEFVNSSSQPRKLYWLDFSGARHLAGTMQPGQRVPMQTYVSHPWLVTDGSDTCLGVLVISRDSRRIEIK